MKDAKKRPAGKRRPVSAWLRPRVAERRYGVRLRQVARQVGALISGHAPEGVIETEAQLSGIEETLRRYADLIGPWAEAAARYMLTDASRRNERAWTTAGEEMGAALRQEIQTAPTGELYRRLMAEQVTLIKSLPLDAAQRVHDLVIESRSSGQRATEIAKEIMRTGDVTQARATLIARTESARASSVLTQARAQHIGSTHFIWRTAGDYDVRDSHAKIDGHTFRWDAPPKTDNLPAYIAGAGPNCRCWPEPVLPEIR